MSLQRGDIIDEAKRFNESCRFAMEVIDGGAGFSKVVCCGNELTVEDKVDAVADVERFSDDKTEAGVIIDERKNNPESCGLKVRILGGGAGLQGIVCCGNELTVANDAV